MLYYRMKKFLIQLFVGIPSILAAQFIEGLDFGYNPGNLEMSIYLPKANSSEKLPLVIALHGCSQNAKSMAKQTGWNELAEKYNFIVLYPEQRRRNNGSNCFNWFELNDISKNSGESESINSMMDFAFREFNLDDQKVFIYGLSAGAAMGVVMMVNYPNRFKSGAIYAGLPYKTATSTKEGFAAVRNELDLTPKEWGDKIAKGERDEFSQLILLHGKKDKIVPIHYSYELVEQWCAINHMDTFPENIVSNFNSNPEVTRLSYIDENKTEKIIFYQFDNLRHEVAIDPGKGEKQGGKKSIFSKDIGFFSTYWVAKEFGLIP